MYKLSIIIPHYNSPFKLNRLLNSIPNISDTEVIVVDDRSNKELKLLDEIIEKNSSKNVIFLNNNRENKGAGTCRNIGLDHARGKWLLFADADDYFLDNFYKNINKYFEDNHDIIFFEPTSWDDLNNDVGERHKGYSYAVKAYIESNNDLYIRYKFGAPWSKLINHEFVKTKAVKFDEVIASNDVMFSIKTGYYAKSIEVSKDKIYCVTKNKGSLTQNTSLSVYRSRLDMFLSSFIFLKNRLSKTEFKHLNYKGRGFLINTLKYKLGIKEFMRTYRMLRKHKVKIYEFRLLNPFVIITKTIWHFKDNKSESKYKMK